MGDLTVDRGQLREQPLSPDEKRVLSGYFQLEGRRQFDNYRTILRFKTGQVGGLYDWLDTPPELTEEIDEKRTTLELSQREHWIDLIESIHSQFFQDRPSPQEVQFWTLLALEKHTLVQIETGRDEFKQYLDYFQHQQLPLIRRLGEIKVQSYTDDVELFYDLLDLEGLNRELFLA